MLMDYPAQARRPNLLRDMMRMQGELSRLFGGVHFAPAGEFPPVNLWTSPQGAMLMAEIPGVDPEKLEITVHRNTVTLRGTREAEPLKEGAVMVRQERPTGEFARRITLPFRVDPDKASSRFENGILMVELPRPEADKPRQINVAHG